MEHVPDRPEPKWLYRDEPDPDKREEDRLTREEEQMDAERCGDRPRRRRD